MYHSSTYAARWPARTPYRAPALSGWCHRGPAQAAGRSSRSLPAASRASLWSAGPGSYLRRDAPPRRVWRLPARCA